MFKIQHCLLWTAERQPEAERLDHGEKKISIVLERDQNQAVLRISNQVTHPEQINIDQVFERFYKADVARSKTSTGLGLSIAKELVSRMDGDIEAKIEKKEFIVEMNFPIVTDAKQYFATQRDNQ